MYTCIQKPEKAILLYRIHYETAMPSENWHIVMYTGNAAVVVLPIEVQQQLRSVPSKWLLHMMGRVLRLEWPSGVMLPCAFYVNTDRSGRLNSEIREIWIKTEKKPSRTSSHGAQHGTTRLHYYQKMRILEIECGYVFVKFTGISYLDVG